MTKNQDFISKNLLKIIKALKYALSRARAQHGKTDNNKSP